MKDKEKFKELMTQLIELVSPKIKAKDEEFFVLVLGSITDDGFERVICSNLPAAAIEVACSSERGDEIGEVMVHNVGTHETKVVTDPSARQAIIDLHVGPIKGEAGDNPKLNPDELAKLN